MTMTLNVKELRAVYYNYLRTEKGKRDFEHAIRIKREVLCAKQLGAVIDTTDAVVIRNLPALVQLRAEKIEITGIALNNLCHSNSQFFTTYGYEQQLGYNITGSSQCNSFSFEIHTVNKKDGKFYDFTKDYNEETTKWFYPLPFPFPMTVWIQLFGRKYDLFDNVEDFITLIKRIQNLPHVVVV